MSQSDANYRVSVDMKVCVGHGRCYELAPHVFDEDERGHCRIRTTSVAGQLEKQALRGEANCPEGAIVVEPD